MQDSRCTRACEQAGAYSDDASSHAGANYLDMVRDGALPGPSQTSAAADQARRLARVQHSGAWSDGECLVHRHIHPGDEAPR